MIMKVYGLLLVVGTAALMFLCYSSKGRTTTLIPGTVSIGSRKGMALMTMVRRKLEGSKYKDDAGEINLEDYRPIDPVPSSTASIKPGPIQHGNPLMPYIPEPELEPSPPPSSSKHGRFPSASVMP